MRVCAQFNDSEFGLESMNASDALAHYDEQMRS